MISIMSWLMLPTRRNGAGDCAGPCPKATATKNAAPVTNTAAKILISPSR